MSDFWPWSWQGTLLTFALLVYFWILRPRLLAWLSTVGETTHERMLREARERQR